MVSIHSKNKFKKKREELLLVNSISKFRNPSQTAKSILAAIDSKKVS